MKTSTLALLMPLTFAARWRHALTALGLGLLMVGLVHYESAAGMVAIWSRSDTFAHGFLIPPIVAWLIWRERRALATRLPQASPGWLLLFALVSLLWLLGELAAVNALTQVALVGLWVLTVPAVLGTAVARQLLFPLGFLFFAVPVGEFMLPQLMEWTANFTVFAVRLSGVPVYREGLNFVIPSGRWGVVEACSGVRYLIASVAVGTLFAYLNYQSNRRRLLFVAVAIVVPVVANWVRAYLIVMLGHLSNNRLATGVDHLLYGWLFFGVVMLLMFMIGSRWAQTAADEPAADAGLQTREAWSLANGQLRSFWLTAVSVAALASVPPLALHTFAAAQGSPPITLDQALALPTPWDPVASDVPTFRPAFQNPSAQLQASYRAAGPVVGLYLGVYQQQARGRSLVSSDNALVALQDPHWSVVARSRQQTQVGQQSMPLRVAELRPRDLKPDAADNTLLAWQLYWINGRVTDSDYLAKAYTAWNRLQGRADTAAVIVLYTAKGRAGSGAAALAAFLQASFAAIEARLMNQFPPGQQPNNVNLQEKSS